MTNDETEWDAMVKKSKTLDKDILTVVDEKWMKHEAERLDTEIRKILKGDSK